MVELQFEIISEKSLSGKPKIVELKFISKIFNAKVSHVSETRANAVASALKLPEKIFWELFQFTGV